MKTYRTILLAIAALGTSAMLAQTNWVGQVEDLMDRGEFKKAEKLMSSLPKKVRAAEEVRIDSLNTIMGRIRKDFNMTPDSGLNLIKAKMPAVTAEHVAKWKRDKKIEYMVIDGKEWWFRKAVRNLWLLATSSKKTMTPRRWRPTTHAAGITLRLCGRQPTRMVCATGGT